MKMLVVLLFLLSLVSCNSKEDGITAHKYAHLTCNEEMEVLDGRDRLLVIGDSISIGYGPYLSDLYPELQYLRQPCNGRNSQYGVYKINEWLSHATDYDICILNHGIWDSTRDNVYGTSVDDYRSNLTYEIAMLKARCQKIVIPSVTHLPENVSQHFNLDKIEQFNEALEGVASSMAVKFCDIHAVSLDITDLHINPDLGDDVHWQDAANEIFADELKACIDSI